MGPNAVTLSELHAKADRQFWAEKLLLMTCNDLPQKFTDNVVELFRELWLFVAAAVDILNTLSEL